MALHVNTSYFYSIIFSGSIYLVKHIIRESVFKIVYGISLTLDILQFLWNLRVKNMTVLPGRICENYWHVEWSILAKY